MEGQVVKTPYLEAYWIASQAALATCSFTFVLYLVNLSVYLCRYQLSRRHKILIYLIVFSVVMAICRVVSDEFVAFMGWQNDEYCLQSVSASLALYSASNGPVYVFLWLRQSFFYSNPLLKRLVNKKLTCVNRVTLVVLVFGVISVTVFYQIPTLTEWVFQATSSGCRDTNDQKSLKFLPLIFLLIISLGRFFLLGLMLYPLLELKNRQNDSSTHFPKFPPSRHEESLLKRAVLGSYNENLRRFSSADEYEVYQKIPKRSVEQFHSDNDIRIYNVNRGDDDDDDDEVFHVSAGITQKRSSGSFERDATKIRRVSDISKKSNRRKTTSFYRINKNKRKKKQKINSKKKKNPNNSAKKNVATKRPVLTNKQFTLRRSRTRMDIRREYELYKMIQKVFMLTLLCLTSDIIATMVEILLTTPELVYLAIKDINLLINITSIIATFKEWKFMVLPPCEQERSSRERAASISSQGSTKSLTSKNSFIAEPLRLVKVTYIKHDENGLEGSESRLETKPPPLSPQISPSHTNIADVVVHQENRI